LVASALDISTGVPGFLFRADNKLSIMASIHDSLSADEELLLGRIIMMIFRCGMYDVCDSWCLLEGSAYFFFLLETPPFEREKKGVSKL
jgi:hypothetical protein